jgi:hypothetical protein
MKVDTDGFSFDFTDALNAFVFDETDPTKPTYHGLPMKAVDVVAELAQAYIYVEIKDFYAPEVYNIKLTEDDEEMKTRREHFKWLKNYLKYKYRDSYLYRHAEHKSEKPIHYICLLTFDNALNVTIRKELQRELPVGVASTRWKQEIIKSCQVVNMDKWNETFPKWPVHKIAAGVV